MPPLMQLPAYEIKNALVNFEPLNNGLDSIRTAQVQNRKLEHEQDKIDIDRDKFGLLRDQHENQKRIQQIELMGNQALAVAQLPPGPARDVAHARLMSQHPNAASLDPRYRDSVLGPQLIAADAGKARDKLGDELKRAQINMTNSHASAYRAMASAKAAAAGEREDPYQNMGMDENGALVPLGRSRPRNALVPASSGPNESQPVIMQSYLGAKNDGAGESIQRDSPAYGAYGTMASGVPGIVTTAKGATDQPATRAAAGQRAIDSETDEVRRERLINNLKQQQRYTHLYGKAPSGMAYGPDGKLISLKDSDTQTERSARVIAEQGKRNIDRAIDAFAGEDPKKRLSGWQEVVGDSWKVPYVGLEVGGWGAGGKAYRDAKRGVIDLVFSLSGKSVSNNERAEFLDIYMPKAGDSEFTKKDKLLAAREYFDVVQSARNRGANDDEVAGIIKKGIDDGQKRFGGQAQQSQATPPAAAGGWVDVGGGVRVREKR